MFVFDTVISFFWSWIGFVPGCVWQWQVFDNPKNEDVASFSET